MHNLPFSRKILIISGIFLVPIFINFLLNCTNPLPESWLVVMGDNNGWLNFFGCYCGAIVTAGTAYYILMKTLEANKIENDKQRKQDSLEKTRGYLAEAIASLQPINIITYPKLEGYDGKFKNLILKKCEDEYYSALNLWNTITILYLNDELAEDTFLQHLEDYIEQYRALANEFAIFIGELNTAQHFGILHIDPSNDFDAKNKYRDLVAKSDNLEKYWTKIGTDIQDYLIAKQQEIDNLKY